MKKQLVLGTGCTVVVFQKRNKRISGCEWLQIVEFFKDEKVHNRD